MPITTAMVGTVCFEDGATLTEWWDKGEEIGIHIDSGNGPKCVDR